MLVRPILLCAAVGLLAGSQVKLIEDFTDVARAMESTAPDPGQMTVEGCTCSSSCGATIDFSKAAVDWCYTENDCGHVAVSRGFKHYDYCVYPANNTYEGQSAGAKQAQVWSMVSRDQSSGSYPAGVNLAGIFTESVRTSGDNNKDYMPAGRKKYIHCVGSVAQFKFVANSSSPYTGIFKGGEGLIRMSAAAAPSSSTLIPGFAIKFFRTGRESANFFAMPSLNGQSDFNFFAKPFTNNPPVPDGIFLKIASEKFTQASMCPVRVGTSDAAEWDSRGRKEAKPNFPWEIRFVPSGAVRFPSAPYDLKAMGEHFRSIPVGTTLFNVMAYDMPSDKKSNNGRMIGSVISTSQAVTSNYGDNHLFFRHVWTEYDVRLRPEFLADVKKDEKYYCSFTGLSPNPPSP
eukprot:NODE_2526_length_1398_cov_59.847843_g2402_i0.p1 GENE.NODE_2526_length_1398_cov_59.847843_g2402_i0~~NODE_2526_length_1398_cov_59.847843_g2402_i0.p1  ORF type:complete len:418 (+),score=123.63 NODE_2526_length_1398_cov_59.847843_g2402_i0:51-1256(+)